MRYIPTAVLLVLAAVMGLYAAGHKKPKKKASSSEKNRVFASFKPSKATRITWTRDGKKVVLERAKPGSKDKKNAGKKKSPVGDMLGLQTGKPSRPGRWDIVSPLNFPADRETVEMLLSDLETLIFTRKIKGASGRAEYKLRKPRITVEVEGALPAGRKAVLHVGGLDITERNVYVALTGKSEVLVVGKHIMDSVDKGLSDIRGKTALMFDSFALKSLALVTAAGEEKSAVRVNYHKKHDLYRLVDKDRKVLARAHKESVENLKRRLEDVKITRFVEDGASALATHGLNAPQREIIVDDGVKHRLLVGGPCVVKGKTYPGERLAGRKEPPAAVFCVDDKTLKKVFRPGDELRDLKLLSVSSDQLVELRIERGGKKLVLKKDKKKGWRIEAPGSGPKAGVATEGPKSSKADAELIGKFLDDIQAFTILGFAFPGAGQLKSYGLERPAATLYLKADDGREETLELGALSGEHRYVRRKGEAAVAMVHKEAAARFEPDVLKFRDRQVLKFERLDLKRIATSGGGAAEALEKKDGQWTIAKPLRIKADSDAVDAVIRAASDLKARQYVAWRADPKHGFAKPSARKLEFRVEPSKALDPGKFGLSKDKGKDKAAKDKGPVTHVVQVGADVPDGNGCYARVLSSTKAVFELSKETCRDLRSLLADRALLDLTPSDVKAVSYVGPKGTEELIKRGPEWHRKAGPKVDRTKVDDLLSTLQNLRAARVTAYGKPGPSHGAGKPYITVTIGKAKDRKVTVFVGSERKAKDGTRGRLAWRSGRDVIYLLPAYSVKDLEKVSF